MAYLFSAIRDLAISSDGDLVISNNDLAFNSGMDWFIQEVNKILKSTSDDWYFHPNVGADLMEFYGQPNVREVGKAIEDRIRDKITLQNIQFPALLGVKVIPMSRDSISVFITIEYTGKEYGISKTVFDLQNGVLKEFETQINEQTKTLPLKNPYIRRIQ